MKRSILLLAAIACLPSIATAQWFDNFDAYPPGSINGLGGWQGWDNVAAAAGVVSPNAWLSPPHSQEIATGDDSVRKYSGYTSGQWTYSAMQYIPSGLDNISYFILLNKYNDGGPYDWSVQTEFDPVTGNVIDDYTGGTTPIIYNQWVQIRVEIDLTNDLRQFFYNNVGLGQRAWKTGANSVLELAAVDLYSTHTHPVYYDDMKLVPEPASIGLLILGALALRRR